MNKNSSVNKVTSSRLNDWFNSRQRQILFLFTIYFDEFWSPLTPIQWIPWALSLDVKCREHEDHHSSPCNVQCNVACTFPLLLYYNHMQKIQVSEDMMLSLWVNRVIHKVSSDGLLKKARIYYKPCTLPFDVCTIRYFST